MYTRSILMESQRIREITSSICIVLNLTLLSQMKKDIIPFSRCTYWCAFRTALPFICSRLFSLFAWDLVCSYLHLAPNGMSGTQKFIKIE